jgi:hypothetical protein
MKVAAAIDSSVGIPSDDVTETLLNVHVAVWADPGLALFCVCARRRLNRVFDTVFDFGALHAAQCAIEVELDWLFPLGTFGALRTIAARH